MVESYESHWILYRGGSMNMRIGKWAAANGLIQCMGCKGYDKAEEMMWKKWSTTVMPYCTEQCYEIDRFLYKPTKDCKVKEMIE
jgi:hypothetical protein